MTNYIKYGLVVLVAAAIYGTGYHHAETVGEREIEQLKRSHVQAILNAQEEQKVMYEESIKSLVADLESLRSLHDSRLLELEQFRRAGGDLETCRRERGTLAELAIEGERLLQEAQRYLNASTK